MKKAISLILSIVMMLSITAGLDFAVYATTYNNGDIIELGCYPQSVVTDSNLIENLNSQKLWWSSYDYYSGTGIVGNMTKSDYMQYVDLEFAGVKYRGVKFSEYRPNKTYLKSASTASSQDNNGYYINEIYWFKYEPIEWQIVDVAKGELISVKAIDSQPISDKQYSETIEVQGKKTTHYYMDFPYSTYANNYAFSSLRTWLKSNLLITVFNRCERNNMLTEIPNWQYDSNDKITLPYGIEWSTYTEVTDEIRKATGTDYAKCQGLSESKDADSFGNVYWWINSKGSRDNLMEVVTPKGEINEGQDVSRTNYGIRPVIYIDLTKVNSDSIHNIVEDHSVESTCSQEGKTTGTHCYDCGKVFIPQFPIPKKEHDYFNSYTSSATCTEKGLKKYTCSKCRIEKSEEIPAKGHTIVIDKKTEPSCISNGLSEGSHCSVCKKTIVKQEIIPKTEHTNSIIKGSSPTCTSTGLTDGIKCSVCEMIIEPQQTIEKLQHTIVIDIQKPATCISKGLTEGSHCSVCNEVLVKQESIPMIPHQYKSSVVQATADSRGYTTYTCSTCGDTYNAGYFDAATIYSDLSSAAAGSTIRVPVSIKNNTGILGWKLTFDYDTDVLTPISVDYGEVISGGIQDNIEGDMVPGSINVYWAGSDNEDYNGVMFYINFEVNPFAVGNTKIDVSYSPEDTFDTDFNDVYLDCQPINLSITNNAYSQYAKINASVDDVTAGDDLQLKLNISEIESVTKTNVTVDYNSDNFEFKSISSANGITVKNTDNNGKLALDISGITSAANDIDFVTVTFKCKDKAMSGDYNFSVSSTDKGIICKGCTVKVNPSATSEVADIYADDVTAKYNDEITIPIYIDNNHGLMGYRLDFKYDTSVLQPISTTCGADFSKNGQFNDSIGVKGGEFKVLWNNVDEKLSNGILLNLKFKVLTEEKVDTVISMTYSQPDTFNEKYEDVVFNCKDINVSLNNHQHSYTAVVTEPTCTEEGYTTYTCSCGDSYVDNYVDALGHNYGEWNVVTEATEEVEGIERRECSRCGVFEERVIPKKEHVHSFVADTVVAPTCNTQGYTIYKCKCGKTENRDFVDACGHNFGQWTYNGDAEYISSTNYKNGTQTRICSVCGEEETVEALNTALLRRRGNALALESSITLTTYITKDIVDYYDEVYAEFTRNGKTETVYASDKTFKSGSTVYNIFDYAGISPQAMGDDIEIKFYGIKDGVKYWGETYTYSVTTYVTSTLSKRTTLAKLKTMLVDLMYYGEACQIYQNYKTDSLMTNILTDEQKKFRSTNALNLTNIKDSSYATCENRLVRFGTALRLNNAVEIAIPLNMTNVTLEELTFKVKIGSRDLTYTYSDNPENFEKGKDGYWYFYFDGVYANQMSDEVFITAYRRDEQVSYTLKYSVESYAATVTDSKLKKVTDAMMRYGNSAKAYSGK